MSLGSEIAVVRSAARCCSPDAGLGAWRGCGGAVAALRGLRGGEHAAAALLLLTPLLLLGRG
jgi:hypothetical protein